MKILMERKALIEPKKFLLVCHFLALPFPDNANDEQVKEYTQLAMKWESSKERFLEQYIGPTTKQWQ